MANSTTTGTTEPAQVHHSLDHTSRVPPLAPGYIIAGGHVLAATGLTFAAVAAVSADPDRKLPVHGIGLLLTTVVVRMILVHGRTLGQYRNERYAFTGVEMSLFAAGLFTSNALSSVGTLVLPERMLDLTASTALDVTASWLYMVACAKTVSKQRAPVLSALVAIAADAHVACMVAGGPAARYIDPLWYPYVFRIALSIGTIFQAATMILKRDESKRARATSKED